MLLTVQMEFEQCHCKQEGMRRKTEEKKGRGEKRERRERAREERSSGACTNNKCVVINFVLCLPEVEEEYCLVVFFLCFLTASGVVIMSNLRTTPFVIASSSRSSAVCQGSNWLLTSLLI